MKFLRIIGIFILVALVLLAGGVTYVTLTESGTQWLFTQLSHVAPGYLQIKQVQGRLGEKLTLTGLHYHTADFTLKIEQLNFAWRPRALLEGTFWVEQLSLREVLWRQERPGRPSPEKTTTLPEMVLPLKVVVEKAQIQDLSLQPLKSSPVIINTIALKGNFDGQTLTVAKLGVFAPEGQLQVRGQMTPHGDYPLKLAFQWRVPTPRLGAVVGSGQLEGDLRQLTLYQQVQTPFQLHLRARFFDLLGQPRWVAAIEVPETKLQQISSQWPPIHLGLNLKGAGGLERFKIRGSYYIQGPQVGRLSGKLAGEQVAPEHWALHQLSLEQPQGQGRLVLKGEATLLGEQPQFILQGQWQELAWPLVGTTAFSSPEGQALLNGSTEEYRLKVKTALAGQAIPAGKWRLSGVGDTTHFTLAQLQGDLLDGILTGAGTVYWAPIPAWKLQLTGKSLNPGEQWPQWPGKLAFTIKTSGAVQKSAPALRVTIKNLSGSLRGYPVAAQGRVQLQEATWQITDLKLHSGDSRLALGGTVGKRLALDWRLISPDLSQLAPAAQGKLKAKGHLRGSLERPGFIFHLQGEQLAYQTFQVASITAHADLDSQGKRPSRLLLKATDIKAATQVVHSLTIRGQGIPLHHELSLAVTAPKQSLNLELEGAWENPAWQGKILKAQLTASTVGHWEMINATPLSLSHNTLDLSVWCWQQQAAELCLGSHWQQGEAWQAQLKITDFPLAVFNSLLPEKTTLEGTLAGNAQIRGEAHQLMQAQVQLRTSAGRLTQVTPEGQTLTLPYQGLETNLHLGKARGKGGVQLLLAEPGAAPVSVSLLLPSAPIDLTALDQLPLEGRITMAFADLAFLEKLLPELNSVHGQLRVNLKVAGSMTAPQIIGLVALQKGEAQIPMIGLDLTGIRVLVKAEKTGRVTLEGEVHSGEGQLALNGQAQLAPAADWSAYLTIAGERFEAMDTPEVEVFISPHLRVTAAKKAIRVAGEVVIPEATLVVKDIKRRGGVAVSKDVVIISKKKEAAAKASTIPIYAHVRILLGDKVTVQAFGFRGGIAGNLLVTETPGKPTRGSGEIRVVEGQYKAYGQSLVIRQGQAIFAGPIDNPQLNVEAVRTIEEDDVVAGMRIRGSASAPVMTLFSEPPMNESNILAYLILGRSLTGASGDEGEMLTKAATSLGLAGGGLLAQRIGEIFGLENVGIKKTDGNTQNTVLMLGKHLSPRLYIGYGIGLFERFSTFLIRYTLSEHWSLQAETGLQSGGDLFYNLER